MTEDADHINLHIPVCCCIQHVTLFTVFRNCSWSWSRPDWRTCNGGGPWKFMPCLLSYKEELWKCCSVDLQYFIKVRFVALNTSAFSHFSLNDPVTLRGDQCEMACLDKMAISCCSVNSDTVVWARFLPHMH